jgi:aldehyde:ferredoxin oxidoreductase
VAVKNYALPAHMPELKRSLALLYAVNPFGPDHNAGEHDPNYLVGAPDSALSREAALGLYDPGDDPESLDLEKVRFTLYNQYKFGALDSVGVCSFVWGSAWGLYSPSQLVAAMRAVTGWDVSLWELMKLGERRLNMMRVFNAREGLGRKDDWLPDKCFQPKVGGPSDGLSVDADELRVAIDQYYAMAGWDDDGVPTRGKLMELGLDWVADLL